MLKKFFVFGMLVVLMLSLSACAGQVHISVENEDGETTEVAVINPCELPGVTVTGCDAATDEEVEDADQADATTDEEVEDTDQADTTTDEDVLGENTTLKLGELGVYHAVYDSNQNRWTLGIWPESLVERGNIDLDDLKIKGGTIEFVMPFDGMVNSSSGEVIVDETEWQVGNPIKYNGNSLIKQGQKVTLTWGENNDSAGCQIWFK